MKLSDQLVNQGRTTGYVSFLTALVHHGVIVDGVALVQVASPDRAGPWRGGAMSVEFVLMPRDLWFGYRVESFEGEQVPIATPEKALIDWCWLAEERGLDPRLDEVEWDELNLERLNDLASETGVSYRALLTPPGSSKHDQDRLREEALARLR